MMKCYVWTLPTRLFHWFFVGYILLSLLTSEFENLLDLHAAAGFGIAALLLFRLLWGAVGPKYSRFADWPLDLDELKRFLLRFGKKAQEYPSHNPAASFVLAALLLFSFLTVLSGILAYGVQEGKGILGALNNELFAKMELFESVHELLSSVMLFLIALHIAGVFFDWLLHKEESALFSMINGFKYVDCEDVKLYPMQKLLAAVFLGMSFIVAPYVAFSDTALTQSVYKPIRYEGSGAVYLYECGSCHTLYPPYLLPSASWMRLLDGLEEHFGDDASIEKDELAQVRNFLVAHSAERSTKEAAVYIVKSMANKEDIIAVTDTPFWIKRHENIPKKIFDSKPVIRPSNCKACHAFIEEGFIEDSQIQIPEV